MYIFLIEYLGFLSRLSLHGFRAHFTLQDLHYCFKDYTLFLLRLPTYLFKYIIRNSFKEILFFEVFVMLDLLFVINTQHSIDCVNDAAIN